MINTATLLTGPFVLAESFAVRSLEGTVYEYKIKRVQELSINAQTVFLSRVVDSNNKIDIESISVNLNVGLFGFLKDFYALFPASLLPPPIWDKLPKWVFFFPAEATLDWIKLLSFFLNLWETLSFPYKPVERAYIQIAFSLSCRDLAFRGLSYDKDIVHEYVMQMGEGLGVFAQEELFYSLKQYDNPPLQYHLSEAREMIAIFREQKLHVTTFNIPSFGKPGDKLILPVEDYVSSLDKLLELYESKADKLIATIERSKFEDTPTDSPPASTNNEQIKLTHPQIAILHHYINQPITRNNAKGIAQKYGQTSGQKLETIYKDLISPLTRTAKGKNRVKDIETILPLLSGEAKSMANKELVEARKCNNK